MVVVFADFGKAAYLYNSKSLIQTTFVGTLFGRCFFEETMRKWQSIYLLATIPSRMNDDKVVINTSFGAPHTFVLSQFTMRILMYSACLVTCEKYL